MEDDEENLPLITVQDLLVQEDDRPAAHVYLSYIPGPQALLSEALPHPIHLLSEGLDSRKVTGLHGTALSGIQGGDQGITLGLEMAR